MTGARVYRKPSLQQQDRLPVSSYEEAVRFLVFKRCDPTVSDDTYSALVEITADIYWRQDRIVRRDVIVASREIDGASPMPRDERHA